MARRSSARHRGQRPPGRRCEMSLPVCTPPSRTAERSAARSSRRRRSSSSCVSSPAGRCGSSRARHSASSASRFPDAGEHALVHEPNLERRGPATHPGAKGIAPDRRGVRADAVEVRVQADAAEAALVAQRQAPAVLEAQGEAIPARRRGLGHVDHDAPGHPEVQAERRAVAGRLAPHRLAAAVGGGQLTADQGVGDLAGPVRPADPAVGVVDGRDAAAQRVAGDDLPRALDLGKLRHPPTLRAGGRRWISRSSSGGGALDRDHLRAQPPGLLDRLAA